MTDETKFEQLQSAIKTYGAAAFENLVRCKGLGEAILSALPGYLECEADCVKAVPPGGEFDPRKDYGELAFSFAHRKVIILEPVSFGIALTVSNFEDSGALWLRTMVAIEVIGDGFDVYVAQQPVIRLPLDYKDALLPVLDAIFKEFIKTFKVELLEFNDERFETGIGFVPN